MKKIIFLLILICSLSCKKEWFDYTNKYTGNFEFTTEYTFYDPLTGTHDYKKYVYNGKIKRIRRRQINIQYGPKKSDFFEVEIAKDGTFGQGYLGGSFSDKDHVSIGYRTGGNGGGGYYSITGVRN